MGAIVSSFLFLPPELPTPLNKKHYFWLETRLGNRIPALHIKNASAKYTILYSHGNAEDLGKIFRYLLQLSKVLNVGILAYDYTGYGFGNLLNNASGGKPSPSEDQCYADIDAAYHYLTELEHIPSDRIILYGRSLGSGPSCYLAQRLNLQRESDKSFNVAGLILHSPFLSVFRVVIDTGFTWSSDMFSNKDRICDVGCPTFIIHGTDDVIVPLSHGKDLYKLIPEEYRTKPFWASRMGHNNIEADMGTIFIQRTKKFLKQLSYGNDHKDETKSNSRVMISSLYSESFEEFEVNVSPHLVPTQFITKDYMKKSRRFRQKRSSQEKNKNKRNRSKKLSKVYSCDQP